MFDPLNPLFWTTSALWLRVNVLLVGICIDWVLHEPKWMWPYIPHPVKIMGYGISITNRHFNQRHGMTAKRRRCAGVLVITFLTVLMWIVGTLVAQAGAMGAVVGIATLLAARSLYEHVRNVAEAMASDITLAREQVGMIVGRDTENMSEGDIARTAVETAAENLSDAVIAPAFWFVIGGLPGIFVYKMVSTADSMIGYRNAKHLGFGWAAAKSDHVLNFVPARLTALLVCIAALSKFRASVAFHTMWVDANYHASPNAGWPEAAMAGAIDVWLAGPRRYRNRIRHAKKLNEGARDATRQDIFQCLNLMRLAILIFAAVLLLWCLMAQVTNAQCMMNCQDLRNTLS